jgi:hypothetical protein
MQRIASHEPVVISPFVFFHTVYSLSGRDLLNLIACSIEERRLGDWLAHDVALEEVWKPNFGFVLEVDGCRDGKHLCKIC